MSENRQTVTLSQAQRPVFVGVDVGGTNIKIGLVDDRGRTIDETSIPTHAKKGPDQAVQRMAEAIRDLVKKVDLPLSDVPMIGLATPGTMDIPKGMILNPPNLPGWENCPIRDKLSEAVGRPVAFENDANAAAFGEAWIGSGAGDASIVLLTLGTGVGCGIIIGDLVVSGEHSHGAECGHIIIDIADSARMCGCGQPGHLEAYCSATGVVKWTRELLDAGRESSLNGRIGAGEDLSTLMIFEEAEAGDPLSLEVILETARYLGIGIVTLMHTIDPSAVVLGGAMTFGGHGSETGRRFLERVREEVHRRTFEVLAEETRIDFASLGGDAGYIGAAGIGRVAYRKTGVA